MRCSQRQQPDELRSVRNVINQQEFVHAFLHHARRKSRVTGDFRVVETLANKEQNVPLTLGQAV